MAIQLGYILFIYSRMAFHQPKNNAPKNDALPGEAWPGVTIIVCAHNEHDNLLALLPLLNGQNYPTFEVLVIDDRSADLTDVLLADLAPLLPRLRYMRVDQEHPHVTPKKYALTIALKKAAHEVILLTDADCRPAGPDWLAGMVSGLNKPGRDIVLGVSLYERQPGWVNRIIRYETLFTAVQYGSLALAGKPYMGVGRNLLYRKAVFFENRGFYSHLNVVGGDDDLFINEVATVQNTAVSLNPTTFTESKPKQTWRDWRIQKRRHLSVGKYYKPGHKIRLAALTGSHVLTWLLALPMGLWVAWLAQTAQYEQLTDPLLLTASGLFGFRLLLFWGVVGRVSHRLNNTVRGYAMPVMDLVLAVYYAFAGISTLVNRREKRVQWR
jgi:glycosyltransferase involved in cell wall biosynthesis